MAWHGFHATPETRSALLAARRLARAACSHPARPFPPLVLFGPPGAGKSHLVTAVQAAVSASLPIRTAQILAARDLTARPFDAAAADPLADALRCDLLAVEDLHQLNARAASELVRLLDHRLPRARAVIVTAPAGPAQLPDLPPRLANRLAGGLVVGLDLPGLASRRLLLAQFAHARRLKPRPDVLDWLAAQVPGGVRGLRGAVATLEALGRTLPIPPTLEQVQAAWAAATPDTPLTLDRIAERVASHFGRTVKQLKARGRQRARLWPAQVAMFLARDLLNLPLPRIGQFFGNRDPTTVRHACQKVEAAATADPATAALLKELCAGLR